MDSRERKGIRRISRDEVRRIEDAPGNLAHYMVEHTTMHAWPMSAGRFDIGSLDTYYEACERFGD